MKLTIGKDIAGAFRVAAMVTGLLMILPGCLNAQEIAPSPGQRVVLITGSTGGLGRETAKALANQGDHVIVHGRNVERGKALVAEITANRKGSARFYQADFGI